MRIYKLIVGDICLKTNLALEVVVRRKTMVSEARTCEHRDGNEDNS